MEDAPLPKLEVTPTKVISEILEINQENKTYKLLVEIEEITMKFKITEDDPFLGTYSHIFTMHEIKELHQVFSMLKSFKEFLDYLKALVSNKKIIIKQSEDYISIILTVEYLLKQNNIEIRLIQEEMNYHRITKELRKEISQLKEKIDNNEIQYKKIIDKQKEENEKLFEENKNIKIRINNLEEENKEIKENLKSLLEENKDIKAELNICINYIKEIKNNNNETNHKLIKKQMIDSSIIENYEFEMINSAIKERIGKEIKQLKKLYQATIDGEDSSIFHKKCDNIPNTLTLIRSAKNRRFGGFTSECWESSLKCKYDKNAFLFSLDKKKIYQCKKDNYSICCSSNIGPCFGYGNTIKIGKNSITEKNLKTFESNPQCSYEFEGDEHALSEDGKNEGIFAKEIEIFQIIFQ